MTSAAHMSAFEGKADMTVCGSPLSRSLLGVKRTCLFARHMSAFDPKRTSCVARWYDIRRGDCMRRREFIAALGSVATMPLAASAQQGQRVRRIGALMNLAAEDPVSIARAKAFTEGLQALGWVDGRNVQIDYRWAASKPDLF